jgi:hypothetical protein
MSAALLLAVLYALVGILFAMPVAHAKAWRLAAWVVSAIGYASHIAYERFRLRSSVFSAALHIGLAAALGAFGLAVGANVHSLLASSATPRRHLLLLALAVWPVITGLPAFVVALALNAVLVRAFPESRAD